jgi:putative transposase
MALGSERFKAEVESLTGRRMATKKMGQPVGWRKEKADN